MPHETTGRGLLEEVLARQRQGILSPNAPESLSGGGITGALAALFGGADDPRLTKEENTAASRRARLQAGLAGLVASQESGATALGSIARGALTGQEAGFAGRERTFALGEQESRKAQLQELVASGAVGPELLQQMFTQAIVNGEQELARSIAEVLKTVSAQPGLRARRVIVMPNEEGESRNFSVDLDVGLESRIDLGPVVDKDVGRTLRPGLPAKVFNPETQQEELAFFDAKTLEPVFVKGAQPVVSAAQTRSRVLIDLVEPMLEELVSLEAPTRVEQLFGAIGLREFTGDEPERLKIVGETVAATYVFLLSGVTARQEEVVRGIRLFVPQPGDDPETVELKRRAVRNFSRIIQEIKTGVSPIQRGSLSVEESLQLLEDIKSGKVRPVGTGDIEGTLDGITGR